MKEFKFTRSECRSVFHTLEKRKRKRKRKKKEKEKEKEKKKKGNRPIRLSSMIVVFYIDCRSKKFYRNTILALVVFYYHSIFYLVLLDRTIDRIFV